MDANEFNDKLNEISLMKFFGDFGKMKLNSLYGKESIGNHDFHLKDVGKIINREEGTTEDAYIVVCNVCDTVRFIRESTFVNMVNCGLIKNWGEGFD